MTSSLGGRGPMTNSTVPAFGNQRSGNVVPRGYEQGQLSQFTPEQMQLFQQMFSKVDPSSDLSKLASGDQSSFSQLEAPALKQFGQLQNSIANRFSGSGSFGSRRSSGFQNTQNSAAEDFAERLQSQRMGLQRQAQQDLFSLSNQLLGQKPYEYWTQKEEQEIPWWQKLLGGSLPLIGAGVGAGLGSFGGPGGTLAGASIGSTLGTGASKAFFS